MAILAPLHLRIESQVARIEGMSLLQIPGLHIVGLPSKEVLEARERIRAALQASDIEFPKTKIVLNLAPASLPKTGSLLDLPMALEVFRLKSKLEIDEPVMAWGELGMSGEIRSVGYRVRNVLAAFDFNVKRLIVPKADQPAVEKILSEHPQPVHVVFCSQLREAVLAFQNFQSPQWKLFRGKSFQEPEVPVFNRSVWLSPFAQKMLKLLMVGDHHVLVLGPKGTGKSTFGSIVEMLRPPAEEGTFRDTQRMSELLDPWTTHSQSAQVPFFRCSTSVRPQSLLGGVHAQGILRPGLLSRSHGGYLFADEFLEWHRDSRECLREALERDRVTLSLSKLQIELPARLTLMAVANECPCGGEKSSCTCDSGLRDRYLKSLSGPILDRIDLGFHYAGSSHKKLFDLQEMYQEIATLRKALREKYSVLPGRLEPHALEELIGAHPSWEQELQSFQSLRRRHKTLRLALSLAALEGIEEPLKNHFEEAKGLSPDSLVKGLQNPFQLQTIFETGPKKASFGERRLKLRQSLGRPAKVPIPADRLDRDENVSLVP